MAKDAHQHKKRLGQHFLADQYVIHQILAAVNLSPDDNVLEIGPGAGALTQPMLQQLHRLIALEIDTDLIPHLQGLPKACDRLALVQGDALAYDYSQHGGDLRVVGNLPYNISTPLLFRLLSYREQIKDMHVMLQKEVVDRMVATPGCKAYGRLSVMLQAYCQITALFDVPAQAFKPAPKVASAVARLEPREQALIQSGFESTFERVVSLAFSMRRKTLANNLKRMINKDELESLGIQPSLRPEQLNITQFVTLASFLHKGR